MQKRTVLTLILLLSFFAQFSYIYAVDVTTSGSVTISAQVGGDTGGGDSGGGGSGGSSSGGGGGGSIIVPTTVNFSGMGYPSSKIVILKDGIPAVTTVADPAAKFSASISNLTTGTYTFSLYTEDKEGRHSLTFSSPIYVTGGTTVNVGNIILAPTIDVDKAQVKRGDNIAIFGYSVPNSSVTITVNSDTPHFVNAQTNTAGVYLYNFNSAVLEYGSHNALSRTAVQDLVSATSNAVGFSVGNTNIPKTNTAATDFCGNGLIGDLNCDQKVNLVDFSIMAYWYKNRMVPPTYVDLNHDAVITLVDFSILAYHWTG